MLLALLAAGLSCAGAPPNLVLLSVDTLRADHLGCYGCARNTSPAIDTLAAESLLFEDCLCEVPLTGPSFGAMLSSLYPRLTGTTRNGLAMPASVPLVPEMLRAAGYQTFCVQSNWTLKAHLSGLNRGFDIYDDGFHKKRWGLLKSERLGVDVTRAALDLLALRDAARPFFLWVHYSDPHAPYRFRAPFNPARKTPQEVPNPARTRIKYDSEIAYTDHWIGRLLAELPQENTAILFVADHGESLYEHDYLGHGRRIYQTNQQIPLFIRRPGVPGSRTRAPACALDVGPTLLALAGVEAAPGMLGRNLLAGGSLLDRVRHVETYGGAVPHIPGAKMLMAGRPPMRRGAVRDGWKLILGGGEPELFYLPEDPLETRNRAAEEPERCAELTELIEQWGRDHPRRGEVKAVRLSNDDYDALRSLGYLE